MIKGSFLLITLLLFSFSSCYANEVNERLSDEELIHEVIEAAKESDLHKRLERLNNLEKNANSYQSFVILPFLIKTEIKVNNIKEAEKHANELLKLSEEYKDDWNYGNAIHDANIVLGLVALREKNVQKAKEYLLRAGKAPSSPQMNNFGPNMMLADALLDIGEKKVVIKYLELVKKIWKNNNGRIDSWIASIKGGGKPYFGANL